MILIKRLTTFSRIFLSIFATFLFIYLLLEVTLGFEGQLTGYITSLARVNLVLVAGVLVSLFVADVLLPVPSSLVMVSSGIFLGGFSGGLLSLIGSVLGAVVAFEIGRTFGKSKIPAWLGQHDYGNFESAFAYRGGLTVVVSRLVPIVAETVSVMAGLSNMKRAHFLLFSVIGLAPASFMYSFSGALLQQSPALLWVISIGFLLPLVLWYFIADFFPAK